MHFQSDFFQAQIENVHKKIGWKFTQCECIWEMANLGKKTYITLHKKAHVPCDVPQKQRSIEMLTNSLIVGVKQLHEWCRGSLCIDKLCRLFVQGQLTQDTRRYSLHVLHIWVQQLDIQTYTYNFIVWDIFRTANITYRHIFIVRFARQVCSHSVRGKVRSVALW